MSPQFDAGLAVVRKEIADYDAEQQKAAEAAANALLEPTFDYDEDLSYTDPPEDSDDEGEAPAVGDAPPLPGPDADVGE